MSYGYRVDLFDRVYARDEIKVVLDNCGFNDQWHVSEMDGWVEIHIPTQTQAAWLCEALVIERVPFEFTCSDY